MTAFPALLQAALPEGFLTKLLLQVAVAGAIFWFILIRPQVRQRRQSEDRLKNLKRGDEVVTAGGIVAEILSIKETMKDGVAVKGMEDRIIVKSGESKFVVERGRIARVITPPETEQKSAS